LFYLEVLGQLLFLDCLGKQYSLQVYFRLQPGQLLMFLLYPPYLSFFIFEKFWVASEFSDLSSPALNAAINLSLEPLFSLSLEFKFYLIAVRSVCLE
jgi:hypothetical protein